MTMKASSKKSRKKASTKTKHVDEDQEADLAAGQRGQQVLDPDVAVDAVEGQREHARADQDEDHEGRQLGRRFGRLPQQVPAQPPLEQRQDDARRPRPWRRPRSASRRR